MDWLNYHHLLYFYTVAREGSVARACEVLHLTQPTISGQVRELEKALGGKLFEKAGRGLTLTELGESVYHYAEDIFSLGQELMDAVRGRPVGRPLRLRVGVVDAVPKLIARKLLEPALALPDRVRVVCIEGKLERLLADLSVHKLDVIISDAPLPTGTSVKAFNHLLGECGVSVLGVAKLASAHRADFPKSLDDAPFLLPTDNSSLRRSLDAWFDAAGVRPDVRGEFEDGALMKAFGADGLGLFAVPTAIEREVRRQYRVKRAGRTGKVRERFYAISPERKLRHPAVIAVSEQAPGRLTEVPPEEG